MIQRDIRVINQRSEQKARVITTAFTAIYTRDEELQRDDESEDIQWFKMPSIQIGII